MKMLLVGLYAWIVMPLASTSWLAETTAWPGAAMYGGIGALKGISPNHRRVLWDGVDDRDLRYGRPCGRDAQDALEGLRDLVGVGIGEPDGLLPQRAARLGLGDGRVGLEFLGHRLRFLEL